MKEGYQISCLSKDMGNKIRQHQNNGYILQKAEIENIVIFKTQMTSPPDYSRSPGKQELPTFKTQMTSPPDYSRTPGKQELPTFKTQMISPPDYSK